LAQSPFPGKPYVSLQDPDTRAFAEEDPRGFLARFPDGAIVDEAQRCPALFSYLQTRVDATRRMGEFVLTGSQQFGLLPNITQTVANAWPKRPSSGVTVHGWREMSKLTG
jgi:hypothetical protein